METLTLVPFGGSGGGGGDASVAGSNTQIQYNNNGALGASVDLTWDDGSKELGVGGDINLDDGGTYTTTIQTVTPTANRTISFPNATGTVALVAGSSGSLIYNNAGAYAGVPGATVGSSGNITLNASSGFSGNLLDLQVNGTSNFAVQAGVAYTLDSSYGLRRNSSAVTSITGGSTGQNIIDLNATFVQLNAIRLDRSNQDIVLLRDAAGTLAQRNGTAAQTFRVYNTFTDASNYERGFLRWSSNVFEVGPEAAGTGTARPMRITAATLKLPNLPTYADNTAALAGGLVAGDVYKTATGELRITV